MNQKTSVISGIFLLMLSLGMLSLSVPAQKPEMVIGQKGLLDFNTSVRAGDKLLKPGTYQVQHVMEGAQHVLVIREVPSGQGFRRGNTIPGKEAARLMCRFEPSEKKWKKTMVMLRTNDKGEKEISEIRVAGEKFTHLL